MKGHPEYITTMQGGSGYFAVMVWFNPDMGGFSEPMETGIGRYASRGPAIEEAKVWAELTGLEFKP